MVWLLFIWFVFVLLTCVWLMNFCWWLFTFMVYLVDCLFVCYLIRVWCVWLFVLVCLVWCLLLFKSCLLPVVCGAFLLLIVVIWDFDLFDLVVVDCYLAVDCVMLWFLVSLRLVNSVVFVALNTFGLCGVILLCIAVMWFCGLWICLMLLDYLLFIDYLLLIYLAAAFAFVWVWLVVVVLLWIFCFVPLFLLCVSA